jgi:hypothetical protein
LLGSDYFATAPGTFFDFGPGIGPVPLQGRPIGPGSTDTIVERQVNAILGPPFVGSSDTIPIEIVALSLESIDPVSIGATFFDVFVTLDPNIPSTGHMTISHDFTDNVTPAPEGTFESFFDVFFEAAFTPVSGAPGFSVFDSIRLETVDPGLWSHKPQSDFVIVEGPVGDQAANLHTGPIPIGFSDFFIIGGIQEVHPGGLGRHNAESAIPEPSVILLVGTGLVGLAGFRRKFRR